MVCRKPAENLPHHFVIVCSGLNGRPPMLREKLLFLQSLPHHKCDIRMKGFYCGVTAPFKLLLHGLQITDWLLFFGKLCGVCLLARFADNEVPSAAGGEEVGEHLLQSGYQSTLQFLLQAAALSSVLTAGRTGEIHFVRLT